LNEAKTQAKNYTDKIAKNAYAGVAAAMAMPNMTPSGPGKTVVAAGGGTPQGRIGRSGGRHLSLANGPLARERCGLRDVDGRCGRARSGWLRVLIDGFR
jgi:hypothetical protein